MSEGRREGIEVVRLTGEDRGEVGGWEVDQVGRV